MIKKKKKKNLNRNHWDHPHSFCCPQSFNISAMLWKYALTLVESENEKSFVFISACEKVLHLNLQLLLTPSLWCFLPTTRPSHELGNCPLRKTSSKKAPTQKQKPSEFWQANSLLLCLMESSGGGGVVCAFACDVAESVLSLWERKRQEDQYILCVDFPQSVTCVLGKQAVPRILSLLWIWHELGPRPSGMWWMHYLIFLLLFTSPWWALAAVRLPWRWGRVSASPAFWPKSL